MSELSLLSAAALARPADLPAIEFNQQWVTWGQMSQLAQRLKELLQASHAPTNAKVALVARNHPAAIAVFLGLIAQGYSIRMVYPFQSAQAIARDIEKIAPAAVIATHTDYASPIISVLQAQGIAALVLQDMELTAMAGFEQAQQSAIAPAAPQLEILTSGTTGKPKPFALSFDTIATHIVGNNGMPARTPGKPEDMPPALMFFPVGNISGLHSTLPPLLKGQKGILFERFTIEGWHDYVLRFQPVASGMPPAGIQMLLDADIPNADLSCLKMIGTGAAPLDPRVHRAFEERYGIPILMAYGATEFGGPVASMTPDLYATWGSQKFASVGKALPGMQLRVVEPESGEPLAAGEQGLLEVISSRIGPDWIRTSDVAMIDSDGFVFHRGRADGAIIRGGFKILPETIEQALLLHPDVSAAAVIGIADHRLGQLPAALVQLKPNAQSITEVELEAHLREHLLATHIPARWHFVEQLPRTPMSFKVDRPAVRALFE